MLVWQDKYDSRLRLQETTPMLAYRRNGIYEVVFVGAALMFWNGKVGLA